jgi:hypothetical protein
VSNILKVYYVHLVPVVKLRYFRALFTYYIPMNMCIFMQMLL